jgi:hypothetical protein
MLGLERRRLALGWPMWLVDERSGVQSGYYAKMLHAETSSGRNAGWNMLQLVADALYPDGCGVRFFISECLVPDDETMREKIEAAKRRHRRQQAENSPTHLRSYASAKEARTA